MGLISHPKKRDEDDYHRGCVSDDAESTSKKGMASLLSELHGLEAAASRSYQNHPVQHHVQHHVQQPASSALPSPALPSNTTMPSSLSSMPPNTPIVTATSTPPSTTPSPHEDVSSDFLALQAAKAKLPAARAGGTGGVPSTPVAAGMLRLM